MLAVVRFLHNQIMGHAANVHIGGARMGHINSHVLTEMDYCAACGSLFNKSTRSRVCKGV